MIVISLYLYCNSNGQVYLVALPKRTTRPQHGTVSPSNQTMTNVSYRSELAFKYFMMSLGALD